MKIFDSEFRKNLFNSLVEAGYEKDEARVIVGQKYFFALKDQTINKLNQLTDCIQQDLFDEPLANIESLTQDIQELKKMQDIINKIQK